MQEDRRNRADGKSRASAIKRWMGLLFRRVLRNYHAARFARLRRAWFRFDFRADAMRARRRQALRLLRQMGSARRAFERAASLDSRRVRAEGP